MRPKTKLFAVEFRRILEIVALPRVWTKFWVHFHDFCVQKRSSLLLSSDAFWKFSACKVHRQSYGRIFAIYVSKNEVVSCEVQTHFGGFHLARFTTKVLGAISRFLRPQTKLFAVKFRRIFKDLRLQGSQNKLWAHFHYLCVRKRSCLQWSSDAFWTFFACKFCRKASGRIFTIYASKNEAVCHEVQTDFGSFPRGSFVKKIWVHFLDFCVQKWSCLLLSSDAFWKFSLDEVYEKRSGRTFTICVSKNEAVSCEVQTQFGSFHLARFIKKFWAHYHDLCVQKRSC